MALNRDNKNLNFLFNSILQLENIDECYDFLKIFARYRSLKHLASVLLLQRCFQKKAFIQT